MTESDARVRIDKWLWAARFFKTRNLASQAVDGGKVKLNGERAKPAREIKPGDRIVIHIGPYEWEITVRVLSDRRGPAEVAHTLYEEGAESRARRIARVAEVRTQFNPVAAIRGRPTKKDRRQLSRLTGKR
ncbi:MAG: RNA-binding S4 domain-containing protein [Betaproteobacteria bacterium]|nr:RNA-binding S4 domain-containing protein [Betaproteobacteria bacterium]